MQHGRILILCTDLNIGGAQTVAANLSKYAPEHLHMTYLVYRDTPGDYEQAILDRGHRVLHWPSPTGRLFAFFLQLLQLLRREHFDAVHCHNMFSCGPVMLAARLARVPVRISHSHTTREERRESPVRTFYRQAMRLLIRTCSTDFWACGREAGHVLYGQSWFDRRGVIIANGIDQSAFAFREDLRREIRQSLGVSDCYVIGHAGHYVEVKNQKFLIECMPGILALRPDAVLLLYGDGPDRAMLEQTIRQLGLADRVRLMGNAPGMGRILSAFDVFVFPSLFEGTPLSLLEAQTNGLPCIISDRIPDDAIVSELVTALPLQDPAQWVRAIAAAERPRDPDAVRIRYPDVRETMTAMYRVYETNLETR